MLQIGNCTPSKEETKDSQMLTVLLRSEYMQHLVGLGEQGLALTSHSPYIQLTRKGSR